MAPGPDDLPTYILREIAIELTPILSLKICILPEDWLKANIAPIFKKGNNNLAENYRPVSLTCICCKVMEHILCKHILGHWEKRNIHRTPISCQPLQTICPSFVTLEVNSLTIFKPQCSTIVQSLQVKYTTVGLHSKQIRLHIINEV